MSKSMNEQEQYGHDPEWEFKMTIVGVHRSVVITANCRFPVWPRCLASLSIKNTPSGAQYIGWVRVIPVLSRNFSLLLYLSICIISEVTGNCQIFLNARRVVAQEREGRLNPRARSRGNSNSG